MRHLLCEHQNTICELKAEKIASKEALQAAQTVLENKLRHDLASLLVDVHQIDTDEPIMELKKKHQEEMAQTRAVSEKKLQDAEAKNENSYDALQLQLENQRKTEISQVRDNWNVFISAIMEKDKAMYEEAKTLLKATEKTSASLKELKQIVAAETTNFTKVQTEFMQVSQENQQITKSLNEIQEEVDLIQNKMKYRAKKFNNKKELELNNLALEHELLQKRFKELQLEVAELRETSKETVENMRNKADAKHMKMEKKIQQLTDNIQKDILLC
ncbi:hypothetical protein WMY93_013266 [Mugilogobius chulae]|uniref:Coiled-coil domain-containing protein 39 n=1 Tax=Mugilogobius chulae TaxID=88201 RepID=A0AAW0NYZ4_9GOBI